MTTLQVGTQEYVPIEHLEAFLDLLEARFTARPCSLSSENPVSARSYGRQITVCAARFKGKTIPKISIRDYVLRIHAYCPFSTSKILSIIHYLLLLESVYAKSCVLSHETSHRLLLAATVVASKVLDDKLIPQLRYAVVGGINSQQLLGLELALIYLLDGRCWISAHDLDNARSISGIGILKEP